MPIEDSQKVQNFLRVLGNRYPGTNWIPVNEAFAYTSVSGSWGSISFNPSRGYLVKLFVDTTTGEIKAFPLTMFKPDNAPST